MQTIKRKDLLYPELSYKIIGILYEVYNDLGYGYQEKYYEKAVEIFFKNKNINYKRQLYIPLKFRNQKIGNYFLDFLVEDKIVLELKKGDKFSKSNIDQVYEYLKVNDLKLGIIAQFSSTNLKFKRIINEN